MPCHSAGHGLGWPGGVGPGSKSNRGEHAAAMTAASTQYSQAHVVRADPTAVQPLFAITGQHQMVYRASLALPVLRCCTCSADCAQGTVSGHCPAEDAGPITQRHQSTARRGCCAKVREQQHVASAVVRQHIAPCWDCITGQSSSSCVQICCRTSLVNGSIATCGSCCSLPCFAIEQRSAATAVAARAAGAWRCWQSATTACRACQRRCSHSLCCGT